MKKGIALILASASAAALAMPAAAQDNSNFTGPRIEGVAGYDISRPGSSEDIDNAADLDQSVDDLAYGVGVGYDVALGGVVVGVEAEWVESEAQSEYDTTAFTDYGVGNVSAGRDLYAGIRVGVPVTPSTLVYAKGGYTNAQYDMLATDNTTDINNDIDLDGWRVGAGIEQNLGGSFFVKGEYRYSNYGQGEIEAPSGLESDRFDVDIDRHQFMVGAGLRF